MKTTKTLAIAMIAALAFCAAPLTADIILEDWQFNDANGTQLNAVANTGSQGTAFNFGGPRTQNGVLNIGDTNFFQWDVPSGNTFRTAAFTELTTGQYLFEYRIDNWNLGGSDSAAPNNMGVRFNIGNSSDAAQVRFETFNPATGALDIRGRVQGQGATGFASASQFQYGSNNATTRNNFVTFQLFADLDTGEWSARTRAGTVNPWTDLTTTGTGLTSIDRLQLVVQNPDDAWEFNSETGGGTATEYVTLDYATFTQFSAIPEPSSFMLFGMATIGLVARRRRK